MAYKFITSEGTNFIDNGGNHFINGVCVNPLKNEGLSIGDTIRPDQDSEMLLDITPVVVYGHVPHFINKAGKFCLN